MSDGDNKMTEETVCNLWSQGCNRGTKDRLKECAKARGFDKCEFEDKTWNHYPDSPFGNIYICPHGVTKDYGDTESHCIYCDYPEDAVMYTKHCSKCASIEGSKGWHIEEGENTRCLKCGHIQRIKDPEKEDRLYR